VLRPAVGSHNQLSDPYIELCLHTLEFHCNIANPVTSAKNLSKQMNIKYFSLRSITSRMVNSTFIFPLERYPKLKKLRLRMHKVDSQHSIARMISYDEMPHLEDLVRMSVLQGGTFRIIS
jgi:hypothetical protein